MKRALLLAIATLAIPAVARALPSETWVLAIGDDEGVRDDVGLLYAERDAREMAEVLRLQGHVSSERIQTLLGEKAEVVRRTLLAVNTAIREQTQAGRHTALVVYYSGHADASALHLAGTEMPFDELKALVASSPAEVRLLVVDACRSGTVTRVKGVMPAPAFTLDMQDEVAASGLAIVTSSAAGETSQESDRLRGSFFTHHLINALRGAADQDGDGKVTLQEAYAYAYAQTVRSTGETVELQHPTYAWDVKGRGVLVLSDPGAPQGHVGRIKLGDAATYLVLQGSAGGQLEAEVATSAARRELSLPAGSYFVQQRMDTEYREYKVALGAEQEVDLSSAPYREVRYDRLVRQRGSDLRAVHGLELLGGVRGPVLDGEGAVPTLVLGYTVDLPWLTAGVRLRGATSSSDGIDGALPRRTNEYGLGATVQRVIDLSFAEVGFGLLVEGTLHTQGFSAPSRTAPSRTAFGASFGGILSVERTVWRGLALRLEGGPMTELFPRASTADGAEAASALATPFTGWVAGGLVWRM